MKQNNQINGKMKTLNYMLMCLCSLFTAALSAQIPNGDFQTWDSINGYENPRYWDNYNAMTSSFNVLTCQRGIIKGTTDSYLMLISDSIGNLGVLPGVAVSGTFDSGNGEPAGFPYTQRPAALTGKWEYMAQGDDHGFIMTIFTKWDQQSNKRDTIGLGFEQLQGMVMSWESFSIPISYISPSNPDSCLIIMTASDYPPLQYSYLYINDLDFDLNSGIAEQTQPHFKIYPNPSSDKIQLDLTGLTDIRSVELVDIKGKTVHTKSISPSSPFMEISDLSNGMYFIRVRTKDQVITEKFNKL